MENEEKDRESCAECGKCRWIEEFSNAETGVTYLRLCHLDPLAKRIGAGDCAGCAHFEREEDVE